MRTALDKAPDSAARIAAAQFPSTARKPITACAFARYPVTLAPGMRPYHAASVDPASGGALQRFAAAMTDRGVVVIMNEAPSVPCDSPPLNPVVQPLQGNLSVPLQATVRRADAAQVSLDASRWTKYGKDRLYVSDSDGTKVGWVDLLTGEEHPEAPQLAGDLTTAFLSWRATQQATGSAVTLTKNPSATTEPKPSPGPAPPLLAQQRQDCPSDIRPAGAPTAPAPDDQPQQPAGVSEEDLASRRAGAMARQQAVALKQASPVRTFLARALGVHTDERAWRIGADGEEKVAVQLAKLATKDPRWHFLHAVAVGENGADIDHVVIGPAGVFTLNAKHHPGAKIWIGGNRLMVNGQRQPYLRNSAHEARRASRLLTAACGFGVTATGIVVPVGADDIVIKTPPTDVHVVNRRALAKWLRERPAVLTDDAIDAVFAAARRSTTWVQSSR